MRHAFGLVALAGVLGLAACDKDAPSTKGATSPPPSASTGPSATDTKPPAPTKPQLAIDESGASIGGDRVDFAAPDIKGRLAVTLEGKLVAGETITLDAARDTKTPKVALVFAALKGAKAKGVLVKTPRRDRVTVELPFSLGTKATDCSPVGFIGKDSGIITWTAAGAKAERFTRGMAGPDLTRGSEGLRKLIAACDSPAWFVSADDAVTWGLVVDLVLASVQADDAGAQVKTRALTLLTKAPSPGKKIDADAD